MANTTFIIDFDSTFIKEETLDILGEISLENHPEKADRLHQIASITNSGMNGDTSFRTSLEKRIGILEAKQSHLNELIERLKLIVSDSFVKNKDFIRENTDNILIVSSGFKEFITPVVVDYGIKPENVYANDFTFNSDGDIIGFNENNPLSNDQGKVKLAKTLQLTTKNIAVIGDGFTDYEIRQAGLATHFFAFTENVSREKVVKVADYVVTSFDEILEKLN